MTERAFQAKLLKALRSHPALQHAVIWKHTDARNGGIPDVSITLDGRTQWFELKVAPNKASKLQEFYLKKLGSVGHVVTLQSDYVFVDGLEFGFKEAVECIVLWCQKP